MKKTEVMTFGGGSLSPSIAKHLQTFGGGSVSPGVMKHLASRKPAQVIADPKGK